MRMSIAIAALSILALFASPGSPQSLAEQAKQIATGQAPPQIEAPWPPPGVEEGGKNGVTRPRVVHEAKPFYNADAMRENIQGTVVVGCVVLPDGAVGEVKVLRSLDKVHGLDDEAIKVAKQWRFTPGTKDGTPVPVAVTIEFTFSQGAKPKLQDQR